MISDSDLVPLVTRRHLSSRVESSPGRQQPSTVAIYGETAAAAVALFIGSLDAWIALFPGSACERGWQPAQRGRYVRHAQT